MRHVNIMAIFLAIFSICTPAPAQDLMWIEDSTAIPGAHADVIVRLNNDYHIQGFQSAIRWDSNVFTHVDEGTSGLDIETLLNPYEVEFFTSTYDDNLEPGVGWAACAAIFDFSPPFGGHMLAPGSGNSIVRFQLEVAADNALVGSCSEIIPVNGLGHPAIHNILTIDGISTMPLLQGGEICFINAVTFMRGDANDDGSLNLADAIFMINYFFGDGTAASCSAAADSNSDFTIDLGDVIYLINHQFLDGAPPASPWPGCGADPAGESGLGCDNYNHCP
ncbi:MAG: dockerin type I domain-containing protein [Planctomycetota bacterium]